MSKEYRHAARDLQAILLLGRVLATLNAEKNVSCHLTHSELNTLQVIHHLGAAKVFFTASEIAKILQKEKTNVSHTLKTLGLKGYISRHYEETSNRLMVELSQSGIDVVEEAIDSDTKDLLSVFNLIEDDALLQRLGSVVRDIHRIMIKKLPSVIEERKKK